MAGQSPLVEQGRRRAEAEGQRRLYVKQGAKRGFGKIDIPMLTIVLLMLLFGMVMLFSASYPSGLIRRGDSYFFILNQLKYAAVGVVGLVLATLFDYRLLRKFAWPVMVLALVLLVVVLFVPDKNNSHRWIWFNSEQTQGFQPSEIAKLAVILVFAKMISANQSKMRTFTYGFMPFMVVLGVVAFLLFKEPHLSCTILVLGIGVVMMFAGGTSMFWLLGTGALVIAGVWAVVTQMPEILPDYALRRINIWLDPFGAPASDAHQVIQSLIAVGSGGPFGKGIGQSVQKYFHLPEVYNDYIYALVCEELGMVGAVAVILLFLLLLARGVFLAVRAEDKFGGMLVMGISVQIALQAFLHVAVNLNAIPSTGISLPFFSSGGTSLCMLMGQVGIMLSVSRRADLRLGRAAKQEREAAKAGVPLGESAGGTSTAGSAGAAGAEGVG